MKLSYTQLLLDLHTAYLAARRHKRSKQYQIAFEADMDKNLHLLADELYSRAYMPESSICFIIEDPKKREVFAAAFRDRIVHHLYYNYVHELFERTFIADSYSCIKKRGTHYGIRRLESFIRKESLNYKEHCYILKMDISGYFMHIDRRLLLDITLDRLEKMRWHRISCEDAETWNDVVDFDFVKYLSKNIILLNPIRNCIFRGKRSDWDTLPHNRSLFNSPDGCGLPIGNLTSQLFSNVYLSVFDDYVKRTLKVRRYGRYVDDFYIVSNDKEYLQSLISPITVFLSEQLHLQVNSGKTRICDSNYGVSFLGAFLKPHRRYIDNASLRRINAKLSRVLHEVKECQINSYLGILSHCSAYHITKRLFSPIFFDSFMPADFFVSFFLQM